jgi:glycosyltransferase involved in cell wall biosynthesis
MPVYNARQFVGEAIQSILDQSYRDLEFIIVNDGSNDGSGDIIAAFKDPRIKVITIENRGIAGALNEGIRNSTAPFIARMDADDISLPERLEKQICFFRDNSEVGLLGTWATVIETDGSPRGHLRHPISNGHMQFELMFNTPLVHPTVMFRRSLLERSGLYDARQDVFEDYDLWSRMARHTQMANIPEELLLYRAVPTGISHMTDDPDQRIVRQRIMNWKAYAPAITDQQLDLAVHMGMRHSKIDLHDFRCIKVILRSLLDLWAPRGNDRKVLLRRMHSLMLGFHMIGHSSIIHRALDHLVKRIVLALPL